MAIVATALVIMVAGYDTTGSTLSFACYQLAKNPAVQDRLREEVAEVLEAKDDDLKYDDIKKLTYMDQVLAETLRYHTPIGLLQRTSARDYKIPGSDVILKQDTDIFISPMAMHFDPKHYQNPEEFDPEHFSSEAKSKRHP